MAIHLHLLSRRQLLAGAGLAAGAWLAARWPLIEAAAAAAATDAAAGAPLAVLGTEEAADLEAVAEQILPADDAPGARALGVVRFMDRALAGFMAGALPVLREGLARLNRESGGRFATLPFEEQTKRLRAVEDTPFFDTLHFLTVAGAFSLPAHGGNRDGLGFALVGFAPRHVWQPPFGHYDAQEDEP